MDVGARLNPTPLNPTGVWPISRPADEIAGYFGTRNCSMNRGTAGAFGGCALTSYGNLDRVFSYDRSASLNQLRHLRSKDSFRL